MERGRELAIVGVESTPPRIGWGAATPTSLSRPNSQRPTHEISPVCESSPTKRLREGLPGQPVRDSYVVPFPSGVVCKCRNMSCFSELYSAAQSSLFLRVSLAFL
jgi:hypothetical protein